MTEHYSDEAKRVRDAMMVHAIAHMSGYMVCSLQTGKPVTMDVYPSRRDARRHAEKRTSDALLILEVQPDGGSYEGCEIALRYERMLWSNGVRTPDTLESEENSGLLSIPEFEHDRRRMARQLITGKPLADPSVTVSNLPSAYRKAN